MLWGQALGLESQGFKWGTPPSPQSEAMINGLTSRTEMTSVMCGWERDAGGPGVSGRLSGRRKDSFPKQLFCRMESTEHMSGRVLSAQRRRDCRGRWQA